MDIQSLADDRSETKDLAATKRATMEDGETSQTSHKRLKSYDLQSVCLVKESAKEAKNRGLDLDLNAEQEMSSSINNDPFYPFKNYTNLKSADDSECGSSVGPLDSKNPMRVWRGLKQNNFMSTNYGALPKPIPIPKTRGRKRINSDAAVMKKKIEQAKKEQVDRFAKVAAPIGLLNGLNPGIINHVRNSKQVHSIIEALVRSEKTENRDSGKGDILLERRQMREYSLFSKSSYGDSYMGNEDDGLGLKLSSSVTVASENNTSCLSNEESGNINSVTSLSVRAANVASQWLDLLNQDIKGRLAALRRSKKRVQAVITMELPLLISREFSSNHDKETADVHAVRWSNIFGQMDKSLSEEESHLENWLNQVKEMQLHCERGLYSQDMDPIGNSIKNRLGEGHHNSGKGLAVKAAAASIYSTCNFLLTAENLPCR
ncbi:hypothetical protein ACP275_06G123600 [Erythranthe tilingii]